MKKKILVTGGAGFIGSHVCEALLSRGDKVVVIDDFNNYYDPKIKKANVSDFINSPNFILVKADIRDRRVFDKVFNDHEINCVVHLAARAGVRPSLENPELYYSTNVMGTLTLLEKMKQYNIPQLIFASSSSVYGNRKKGPFKETDDTDNQISPYGATKKSGELLTATFAHLYGIKTTCLRFFTVYGPRNRPDMALFLFTDAIYKGKPIIQYGDGNTGRDYTFVSDTVSGILAAIDKPLRYEIVNLGNHKPILLKDLIKRIAQTLNKEVKVKKKPMQSGDVELTYADISKAKSLLSYDPQYRISDGIKRLVEWYKTIKR